MAVPSVDPLNGNVMLPTSGLRLRELVLSCSGFFACHESGNSPDGVGAGLSDEQRNETAAIARIDNQ